MSDRASKIVLVCEDRKHASLACEYMKQCGINTNPPLLDRIVASEKARGGNVGWVVREFPRQMHACKQRSKRTKTLLVVVVDADQGEVSDRRADLAKAAEAAGLEMPAAADDLLVVLIPRRHVETWIRAALDVAVNESNDYKYPDPTKAEVRAAAERIHGWAHDNPKPGATCVASLKQALPEWRKIG